MVQISEVKGNTRENRTAAHTHIKGLGLRSDGYAQNAAGGFVGQAAAREVSCLKFSYPCLDLFEAVPYIDINHWYWALMLIMMIPSGRHVVSWSIW